MPDRICCVSARTRCVSDHILCVSVPAYFPQLLQDRFREHFASHPLRREIVDTAAVNHVINHAELTFIPRLRAATGRDVGEIVAAYLEADRTADATELRAHAQNAALPEAEFATLVDTEDRLEEAARAILDGRTPDRRDALRVVESK